MANKIDITATENAQLTSSGTSSDLAHLKSLGARALPHSPTASGWSADAILKQLYKQPELLFAWLKRLAEAQLDLANEVDNYLDDLSKSNEVPKVYSTLALATTALGAGQIDDGSIVIVSDGSDYAFYYANSGNLTLLGQSIETVLQSIADIISGTTVVNHATKADQDGNGNNIAQTYETKADATTKDNANVHKTGNETIAGNKTFTGQTLFGGHITFEYQKSILMWEGFVRTTTENFLQIGSDSAHIVTYAVPYKGSAHYGETWTIATNEDLAKVIDGTTAVENANHATYDSQNNEIHTTYETKNDATSKLSEAKNYADGLLNAVEQRSDVVDVIGTYANLQAYDISNIGINDIVKVLNDESENGKTSYYRLTSTSPKTWTLIGSEGPYYTQAVVDSNIASAKSEAISSAVSTAVAQALAQAVELTITEVTVEGE